MTGIENFEAKVVEQHERDDYVIAVLDKFIPTGFIGSYAEIDGKKHKLLDQSKALIGGAIAIKDKGNYVGKTVVLDKKDFDRGYKRFYW